MARSVPDDQVLDLRLTQGEVTDRISALVQPVPVPRPWLIGFGLATLAVLALLYAIGYLFAVGVGIWGVNVPVAWGYAIINFVWWIGIGHPVFNVPRFPLASRERFFLCIETADPQFHPVLTRSFLEGLQPHEVSDVPA